LPNLKLDETHVLNVQIFLNVIDGPDQVIDPQTLKEMYNITIDETGKIIL